MNLTMIAAGVQPTRMLPLVVQTDSPELKQDRVHMDTLGVMQTAAKNTRVNSLLPA